jgi:hypothetical protein
MHRERYYHHLLQSASYSTGASMSNPLAYFLNEQLGAEWHALPSPPYRTGVFMGTWGALAMLHARQPFGSRAEEFDDFEHAWDYVPSWLENYIPGRFCQTKSRFSPSGTFAQARELLKGIPGRFFLWVHVYAPHSPYLPNSEHLGRFLPANELRTSEEQRYDWHYPPKMQNRIDKVRLRYDEFVV